MPIAAPQFEMPLAIANYTPKVINCAPRVDNYTAKVVNCDPRVVICSLSCQL